MSHNNHRVPLIGSKKVEINISVLDEDLRVVAAHGGLAPALQIQIVRELRKLNEVVKSCTQYGRESKREGKAIGD